MKCKCGGYNISKPVVSATCDGLDIHGENMCISIQEYNIAIFRLTGWVKKMSTDEFIEKVYKMMEQ